MSRSTRRFASVALLTIVVAVSVTGCAAGFNASTSKPFAPSNGSVAQIGNLRIRNVVIVQSVDGGHSELYTTIVSIGGGADGNGTVSGATTSPEPDSLTGISVTGAGAVAIPGGQITIPPGAAVVLGPNGTHIVLDSFTRKQGEVATVTLSFATAGTVSLSALVMNDTSLVSGG